MSLPDEFQRIDCRLFRRILRLAIPFWWRRAAWAAWLGLGIYLLYGVSMSYVIVQVSELLKRATDALLGRDWGLFQAALMAYLALLLVQYLLPQARAVLTALMHAAWQGWLTKHVLGQYLARHNYYDISLRGDLDNPDQRISENVAPFTENLLQLLGWSISVLARVTAVAAVLIALDRRFIWIVPLLALLQLVAAYWSAPYLVRRQVATQVAEGDLRRGLVHLRDHAEAVAFYGGEALEQQTLELRTKAAASRQFQFDRLVAFLDITVNAFFYLAWLVLPYLLLGERVVSGQLSYGTLMQAMSMTLVMQQVVDMLTLILSGVGRLAMQVTRLAPLQERLALRSSAAAHEPGIARLSGRTLQLQQLSLQTPQGDRQLVQGLNLHLQPGMRLLIVGDTGVGKSSLLRAMAGLWRRGSGQLILPDAEHMLFLPQRPYFTLADLRSQLCYAQQQNFDDAQLLEVLPAVRLDDLADRHGGLSSVRDWGRLLSPGEQQRLAFARILLRQPELVFLDEATSAVDSATERHLYARLLALGKSFVSVGHRLGIAEYHSHVLVLEPGGGWQLLTVEAFRSQGVPGGSL
jgi:putative ATP-binding cassette transporter